MILLLIYLLGAIAVFIWGIAIPDRKFTKEQTFWFSLIGAVFYPIPLVILPFHLFFVEYEVHLKIKKLFTPTKNNR